MSEPTDATAPRSSSKREKRSTSLIARFDAGGFAVGWKMAVSEAFKPALDIRRTQRMVNKEPVLTWTQGHLFAFHEGDTIYDSRREDWTERLKELQLVVQVLRGKPVRYVEGLIDPGSVLFRVLRPNAERTAVIEGEILECSQQAFVRFLQAGKVDAIGTGEITLLT